MKRSKWLALGLTIGFIILVNRKMVLAFFKLSEFDSPDAPGSGGQMRASTLKMLDKAREYAGIPFFITSGVRTDSHNKAVGGVKDSAHPRGYAVDIRTLTLSDQKKVVKALVKAGFKRIGIGKNFVHADNDPLKPSPAAWGYDPLNGFKAPYDPFSL